MSSNAPLSPEQLIHTPEATAEQPAAAHPPVAEPRQAEPPSAVTLPEADAREAKPEAAAESASAGEAARIEAAAPPPPAEPRAAPPAQEAASQETTSQEQPSKPAEAHEGGGAREESAEEESGTAELRRRMRLRSSDPSQAKPVPSIAPSEPAAPAEPQGVEPPHAVPTREQQQAAAGPSEPSMPAGAAAEPAEEARAQAPAPPPPRTAPVEVPRDADLDADIEAEIAAALSSGQLDTLSPSATETGEAAPAVQPTEETLEPGAKLRGKILSVNAENVFLDLGFRLNGVVQTRQFEAGKKPEPGQQIEVVVDKVDPDEGLIHVNLPRGTRKIAGNWEAVSKGQIVDCLVTKTNKGGLEVTISTLRGFLPASQVDLGFVSDLEQYVGQKLRVQVTEVNPKKRNLVVSRRGYLQIERKEAEEILWTTLAEGQTFTGTVRTVKDYGAFIDIGGVDGFLHIGEMSWTRIKHPSELLREGQQVDVKVIGLDPEKKKISLGMRQLTQDPWAMVADNYPVGSVVSGKVTRTTDFGAFVEIEPGLEGLIHISELDYRRVRKVTDVLKVGQDVEAKVLEVDPGRKRVSLSLKALKEAPVQEKVADEDLAPGKGEGYVSQRREPLKGGTGGDTSGGGLFGDPRKFGR